MLSLDDVKKIVKDLPVDEYDVSDDVSLVVYRVDSFEYNEQKQVNRHIDIELILVIDMKFMRKKTFLIIFFHFVR